MELKTKIKFPKRVLIIDRNEVFLHFVSIYFKEKGCSVDLVCDEEKILDTLKDADYDFVVMSWELKKISPVRILRCLRKDSKIPSVPIIITSSKLRTEDFEILFQVPLIQALSKPFAKTDFESAVNNLIDRQNWFIEKHDKLNELTLLLGKKDKAPNDTLSLINSSPEKIAVGLYFAKLFAMKGLHDASNKLLKDLSDTHKKGFLFLNEILKNPSSKDLLKANRDHEAIFYKGIQSSLSVFSLNTAQIFQLDSKEIRRKIVNFFYIESSASDEKDFGSKGYNELEFSQIRLLNSFVGLLNNYGRILVKNRRYREGIKIYKICLGFLFTRTLAAKICFNLALAYVKANLLRESLAWFSKAFVLSDKQLKDAAKGFITVKKILEKRVLKLETGIKAEWDDASDTIEEASELVAEQSKEVAADDTEIMDMSEFDITEKVSEKAMETASEVNMETLESQEVSDLSDTSAEQLGNVEVQEQTAEQKEEAPEELAELLDDPKVENF